MESVLTKITVPTTVLQDLVSRASKCSTMVDLIPLSCLMELKVENNKLTVHTTDNNNHVIVSADITAPDFQAVVDSKKFSSLIMKLSADAEITLSKEDNKLVVQTKSGKYNFELAVEQNGSAIVFPEKTVQANGEAVTITNEQLKSILTYNKCCKAVSKDLPCLFNYYFDTQKALTSDRYKACYNPVKLSDRPVCITPTMMELVSCVMDDKAGVTVTQDDNNIMFSSPNRVLVGSKATDADLEAYPVDALNSLFEESMQYTTTLSKTQLLSVIDRLNIFTSELESYKLILTFDNKTVTVYSPTTQSQEVITYMNPMTVDFEPVSLDVDSKLLLQQLSSCDVEELLLSFSADRGIMLEFGHIKLILTTLSE